MRVAILSQYPKSYSTSRLREACKERNARAQILVTSNFLLQVRAGELEIRYNGAQLPQVDALVPRIGAASVFGGCSVVRHFEQMGVFTVQSARGIGTAHDKFRTMQELSRHNIPIPPTVFVFNPSEVQAAIEFLGGTPVVISFFRVPRGPGLCWLRTSMQRPPLFRHFKRRIIEFYSRNLSVKVLVVIYGLSSSEARWWRLCDERRNLVNFAVMCISELRLNG